MKSEVRRALLLAPILSVIVPDLTLETDGIQIVQPGAIDRVEAYHVARLRQHTLIDMRPLAYLLAAIDLPRHADGHDLRTDAAGDTFLGKSQTKNQCATMYCS